MPPLGQAHSRRVLCIALSILVTCPCMGELDGCTALARAASAGWGCRGAGPVNAFGGLLASLLLLLRRSGLCVPVACCKGSIAMAGKQQLPVGWVSGYQCWCVVLWLVYTLCRRDVCVSQVHLYAVRWHAKGLAMHPEHSLQLCLLQVPAVMTQGPVCPAGLFQLTACRCPTWPTPAQAHPGPPVVCLLVFVTHVGRRNAQV
jgi:hypothetical protein